MPVARKFTTPLSVRERNLAFAPSINVKRENGHYIVKLNGSIYCIYNPKTEKFENPNDSGKVVSVSDEVKKKILSIVKAFPKD